MTGRGLVLPPQQAGQHSIADGGRRHTGSAGEQTDPRRRVLGLGRQAGKRLAIRIERGDVENRDAWRRPDPRRLGRGAPPSSSSAHPLQAEAVTAFDAERPRQLALAGRATRLLEVAEDVSRPRHAPTARPRGMAGFR